MDSLLAAHKPTEGWKLLAVDNGSTDSTADILQSYEKRLPVTVLKEPVSGKNRGINRALELAEGDLYIFIDDDVIVNEDWLLQWRATADTHPDYRLFAGLTKLHWPHEPPSWDLRVEHYSIIFGTNEHMREGPCDPTLMFGTNMAIRASVFADGTRFSTSIGPDGSKLYAMGSETELAMRLKGMGYTTCWFAHSAQVEHIIRPEQMDMLYMIKRGYRFGRGQGLLRGKHHYLAPELLRRKNLLRWLAYPILMSFYDDKEAWARQWEWAVDQGFDDGIREANRQSSVWSRNGKGPCIAMRFRRPIARNEM